MPSPPLINKNQLRTLMVLGLLIVVLFWPALQGMFTTWMEDSNNSHGVLVPLIVAYLVREKITRDREKVVCALGAPPRYTWLGLVGMLGSLGLYAVSMLTDIVVFKNVSFIAFVASSVLFVLGLEVSLQFLFPLFFLGFMVPVPNTLYGMVALPMQLFATKVTVGLLSLTSLPIVAEGNIIRVGGNMLEVAEACSGLRSLMSFIMLSLLFAYLAKISWGKKVFMVVLALPIALAGNILRLLLTSFIAYIYGSRVATGFIHDASGYIMFVLAFGVFFWLARKLEK